MKKHNFLGIVATSAIFITFVLAGHFLVQTAQPSADVVARVKAQSPSINVDDFQPGDVKIVLLNNLPIVVWRRNEADMALAAIQNDPEIWNEKYSKILGQADPVFADDANLTLDGEWFFAVAYPPDSPGWIPLLRAGNYDGFFDSRYAGHYDVAGRIRLQGRNNLTVVAGEMSEDGQTIELNLRR